MITVPNKLHVYHHLYKLSLFHMLKSYINTNMLIISKMYIIDKYIVYYAMLFCMYGIPNYGKHIQFISSCFYIHVKVIKVSKSRGKLS